MSKKVTSKIHPELVSIATANQSILAKFAILEARDAEIMYFCRSLLLIGLKKYYKNNYITTEAHLRPSKNANKYFKNSLICVTNCPTNFDSLAMLKKCKKDAIIMVKNGILLEHSDFYPHWQQLTRQCPIQIWQ